MTPELKQYLTSWLTWVERGAPEDEPYSRWYGLCDNAPELELSNELTYVFHEDGLDEVYPFGEELYEAYQISKTQHLCPKRLAWVKKKLDIPNVMFY